ncbi:hypothetical protein [Bacillus phage BSTP8]|nr:hypothetical protein BSTP5_079 [Bacillus phage BSTP5]QRI44348.1 hypothetical protein [Bacillus phage BSTP8]QRI44420.1 hypothetical protein [Bacillus phage BSTP10]QRI44468.1 hypothetical protein [Bacillus phage BSTP12]
MNVSPTGKEPMLNQTLGSFFVPCYTSVTMI